MAQILKFYWLEIGPLPSELFKNSYFHFLIIVELGSFKALHQSAWWLC